MYVKYWLILANKMLRPRTVLMMLMFVAIGDAATKTFTDYDYSLALIAVALAGIFISATCLNDLADEEIDKINLVGDKRRPLVDSTTKPNHLIILNFISLVVAGVSLFFVRPGLVWLVLLAGCLSFIYSMPPLRVSYRGIWAALLLPLQYVALPFYLGVAIHQTNLGVNELMLMAGLYISFVGRIILKDFRDVKGDRKFGKRTFLVRHGARATCIVAAVAWLVGDLIISWHFIEIQPMAVVLLQLFLVVIFWTLIKLSKEKILTQQLILVNMVGRLGNIVGLIILAALTLKLYNYSILKDSSLIFLTGLAGAYSVYFLHDLYRQGNKKGHHKAA